MNRLVDDLRTMEDGIHRVAAKVPRMPALDIVLARLLMIAGNTVNTELEGALKPHGLGESEFRTLVVLLSTPDGRAHPGELCVFATQTPTNMTRIIDGLVRRGFVTRAPSEEDRRRIVLRITDAGQRFAMKLLPMLFPRVEAMFVGFSDAEKRRLDQLLHKLIGNLDAAVALQEERP